MHYGVSFFHKFFRICVVLFVSIEPIMYLNQSVSIDLSLDLSLSLSLSHSFALSLSLSL